MGGLDDMADLAHLVWPIGSNERYPCRLTMTGFSTPRETLCRQPMRSQNAADRGADAHRRAGPQRSDAAPDAHRPAETQAAPAPPPLQTEVTTQIPPTRTAGTQRQPNGMMRAPQSRGAGRRTLRAAAAGPDTAAAARAGACSVTAFR